VLRSSIPNSVRDVTFTVDAVAHAVHDHTAGESHDPDGDSTGKVITVIR